MQVGTTSAELRQLILVSGLLAVLLTSCSSSTSGTTTAVADSSVEPEPTTTFAPTSTMPVGSTTTNGRITPRILVFHRTAGYRHSSIEAGLEAIEQMGDASGFEVDDSEDASVFSTENLHGYAVIVFLNTTGEILESEQQETMESFIGDGGGFVGIHAAADAEYDWPWYGELVGAYFESHPDPQLGRVRVTARDHPVVAGLPGEFEIVEEWYNFSSLPSADVAVLATVDESTYKGGEMGDVHPIAWAHDHLGGRAVYIGFGHDSEVFSQPVVRDLISNSILWSTGSR